MKPKKELNNFQFFLHKMTRQSLKSGKFMTYQVTNMFGHVQWPSAILTPVQKRVLLGLRIYVWEYTQKVAAFSPKKLLQIYLVVKERCSCSIVVTYLRLVSRLHANTSSLTYIQRNDWTCGPIWNYATATLTSWKGC